MKPSLLASIVVMAAIYVGAEGRGTIPFDICKKTEKTTAVEKYVAGEDVETKPLHENTSDSLPKETSIETIIEQDNIISNYKEETYHLVLVPVEVDENKIPKRMSYLVENLEKVFSGVNISFSYLNKNIPIKIDHVDTFPEVRSSKEGYALLKKINSITTTHNIAFLVDTQEDVGGYKYFPISEIDKNDSAWITAHEIAHSLSLDDGYNHYSGKEQINNSELFVDINKLPKHVKNAMQKLNSPYWVTRHCVCQDKKIYRFYADKSDIMDGSAPDSLIQTLFSQSGWYFNPLQIEIMNTKIEEVLKQTDE